MATDLTKEFREGMDATSDACPYIATSSCADAWWLGRRWHDRACYLMRGDHRLDDAKVMRGRGELLNVIKGNGKAIARVAWDRNNSPSVGWA